MASDAIKGIAQTYFDAWCSRDFDRLPSIVLEGPFTTGSTLLMTPPGEQTFRSQLVDVALPKASATSPNSTGSG